MFFAFHVALGLRMEQDWAEIQNVIKRQIDRDSKSLNDI